MPIYFVVFVCQKVCPVFCQRCSGIINKVCTFIINIVLSFTSFDGVVNLYSMVQQSLHVCALPSSNDRISAMALITIALGFLKEGIPTSCEFSLLFCVDLNSIRQVVLLSAHMSKVSTTAFKADVCQL